MDMAAPFLDSAGRTQVPFRLTMESFGCAVYWNNETRTAVAEKDGTRVEVPIGAPYLLVNGKRMEMDTTAQIVDTRTYLPIRPVMEAFGAYVTWDNANRLVVIKTGSSLLRVHFLDVGQGDCILIDCGETEVLIDVGNNGAGDEVVSYLTPYIDGKLDYLIATHPDADHVGGLDAVLEAFEVGEVIDSGRKSDTDTYKDYWAAVQAEGCTISYGEDRIIPLSSLAALSILETGNDWEDSNDCSVVAQLTCGNVQVLFTGDMSQQVETKLLPLFGDIDVLKVSHHGSDTASCAEFLSVVKPEYAVISYGLDNAYHHPAGGNLTAPLRCGGHGLRNGKERLHRPHHRRLDIQLQHLPGAHRRGRGCLRRFRRIDVSLKRWYHVFNKPCLAGFECLQGTVILYGEIGFGPL